MKPRRTKLLLTVVVVVVIAGAAGWLRGCTGVDVESSDAVEIARPLIDFEPTDTDVRLVRQGFPGSPVWAVVFSIPDTDDPGEFIALTRVLVDAATGEIRSATDEMTGTQIEVDDG